MRQRQSGFTLIEAALTTAVVGIGILALMHSMAAGTRVNRQGRNITQAVFLAQEIREWTLRLPFRDPDPADQNNPPGPDGTSPQTFVDDLDDLMGVTYSPPRDAQGYAINGLTGWSQTIDLEWRDPDDLRSVVTPGTSPVINVKVTVKFKGEEVLQTDWLVTDREGT